MQVGIATDRGGFGLREGLLAQLRAALIHDHSSAGQGVAWDVVQMFLAAKFTHAPRHVRRLSKVAQLELHVTRTNR